MIEAQVQTTDILPTVLDLLSISPPSTTGNRSLVPYFTETKPNDRVVFGETDYPLRFGWAPLRAVRSGGFKFIEAPRPELYDLGTDPAELKNEYEPWNATVQQLRARDLLRLRCDRQASRPPRVQRERKRSANFVPWAIWDPAMSIAPPTFPNCRHCRIPKTKSRSRTCCIPR